MPAPRLILDTIKDSDIEVVNGRVRARRTGLLLDCDTSVTKDQYMAVAINHPSMPLYFSPYPFAAYGYARLTKHVFEPLSINAIKVTLLYEPVETDSSGGIVFVLTRRTSLVDEETNLHPKDKVPLKIVWKNPHDAGTVKSDVVTVRYRRPYQTVVATGWFQGDVPLPMLDAIGRVNSAPWGPRRALPRGFWLCEAEDDRTEDRGRSYSFSFQFSSRISEDWSSWACFRDPATGVVLEVAPGDPAFLKTIPYDYTFNPTLQANGLLKTGLYDVADFTSIFGFGGPS